jgi:hypothetical protein
MGILSLITGKPGASGFGSASTAEQVTDGVDASALTVLVTGNHQHSSQLCIITCLCVFRSLMLEGSSFPRQIVRPWRNLLGAFFPVLAHPEFTACH